MSETSESSNLLDFVKRIVFNDPPSIHPNLLKERVTAMLETLTEKEGRVLKLRFGLLGEVRQTQVATANQLQITVANVRTIEAKAIRKLRHLTRSNILYAGTDFRKNYIMVVRRRNVNISECKWADAQAALHPEAVTFKALDDVDALRLAPIIKREMKLVGKATVFSLSQGIDLP